MSCNVLHRFARVKFRTDLKDVAIIIDSGLM